jgi:hypothetical protein
MQQRFSCGLHASHVHLVHEHYTLSTTYLLGQYTTNAFLLDNATLRVLVSCIIRKISLHLRPVFLIPFFSLILQGAVTPPSLEYGQGSFVCHIECSNDSETDSYSISSVNGFCLLLFSLSSLCRLTGVASSGLVPG